MNGTDIRIVADRIGGETTIAAMDENSRYEIGRKTYRFVRRVMKDPEMRARIRARAEELRRSDDVV